MRRARRSPTGRRTRDGRWRVVHDRRAHIPQRRQVIRELPCERLPTQPRQPACSLLRLVFIGRDAVEGHGRPVPGEHESCERVCQWRQHRVEVPSNPHRHRERMHHERGPSTRLLDPQPAASPVHPLALPSSAPGLNIVRNASVSFSRSRHPFLLALSCASPCQVPTTCAPACTSSSAASYAARSSAPSLPRSRPPYR